LSEQKRVQTDKSRYKRAVLIVLLWGSVLMTTSCIAFFRDDSDGTSGGFARFRAEGLSLREAAPSALKYIKKYYRKSHEAPDSIIDHFIRQAAQQQNQPTEPPVGAKVLSIAFVGDIMWIRNGWDTFADKGVIDYLSQFDMVFGNLETPVDTASPVPSLLPDYVRYNSDGDLIRSFRRSNGENIFTALSLANNHALDLGQSGLEGTMGFLKNEGIQHSGAYLNDHGKNSYLLIGQNGVKIGFYSAGWGVNDPQALKEGTMGINIIRGIAPLVPEKIDLTEQIDAIKRMRSDSADLIIVFLHWGYEFEMYPDQAIIETGRQLAAAGADLIIGSHPHVVQPFEIFTTTPTIAHPKPRNALIAYSLGNFTTTMYTPLCRTGAILSVTICKDPLTGMVSWCCPETEHIFNTRHGIAGNKRQLMLLDDHLSELSSDSPRRARRLKTSLGQIPVPASHRNPD
jgi:hypothetical protein